MQAVKAPDALSPGQKKLKQARLPFKIISDVSPASEVPTNRKRKLSANNNENSAKVGKICKENGVKDDLIEISDDDSKKAATENLEDKSPNPLVKLVNSAFKKKLQNKVSRKRKSNKLSQSKNYSPAEEAVGSDVEKNGDNVEVVQLMEVDDNEAVPAELPVESIEVSKGPILLDSESDNSEISDKEEEEDKEEHCDEKPSIGKDLLEEEQPSNAKLEIDTSDMFESVEPKSETETVTPKRNRRSSRKLNMTSKKTPQTDLDSSKSSTSTAVKVDSEEEEISESQVVESTQSMKTPKRSSRSKSKANARAKLNESVKSLTSESSTPTSTQNSVTSNQGTPSHNDSQADSTPLTPKQLQKLLDSAKKRDEREKEKLERAKKRQEEKDERDRQKKEKEDAKKREKEEKEELKKKEREEKEEQRRKEKEEKDKQRELEKKLREEKEEQKRKEKEEKEEQRKKDKEARDEERRKKQEAVELEKQESELKKKKAAEAFVNFFVPKQKSDKEQSTIGPVSHSNNLSCFTIKSDMRLAPTVRNELSDQMKLALEVHIKSQGVVENDLYLKRLKSGDSKPGVMGKTWPMEDKDDDDVMVVEDELPPSDGLSALVTSQGVTEKLRPKLLSFHENRRPPYWGTWRKTSRRVRARRPFGQDDTHVDYTADSDDEWEEEAEGESLDGSVAGSDTEPADDYEVDNDMFVPHGYLSDEEATVDEEDHDMLSLSPETQKARLKNLEDEFESELKKPTEKLKPKCYGLIWATEDGGKPDSCADVLWNYLNRFSMLMDDPTPLLQPPPQTDEPEKKKVRKKKADNESPKSDKKKKPKTEKQENKKDEKAKSTPDAKKNQPVINAFLQKVKSTK